MLIYVRHSIRVFYLGNSCPFSSSSKYKIPNTTNGTKCEITGLKSFMVPIMLLIVTKFETKVMDRIIVCLFWFKNNLHGVASGQTESIAGKSVPNSSSN